jgi:glutamate-ammonia-ligase adenylyltransferase
VSLKAFEQYYDGEAETWEFLALTRARVVWASSEGIRRRAERAIVAALRRPRDRPKTAADVRDMRALMRRERPPTGRWDLKLTDGGLVDIEFAAQYLQIVLAADDGPLDPNTSVILDTLSQRKDTPSEAMGALREAWTLQQNLSQVLKVALAEGADPETEPARFQRILAKAGDARTFAALGVKLAQTQARAHEAYERVLLK